MGQGFWVFIKVNNILYKLDLTTELGIFEGAHVQNLLVLLRFLILLYMDSFKMKMEIILPHS